MPRVAGDIQRAPGRRTGLLRPSAPEPRPGAWLGGGSGLSVGLASAASAIDLTGTYTGRLSCSGLDAAGEATKFVASDSELLVSLDGTDLLATIDALPFAGTVVSSVRGTGGALECSGSFRRVDEVEPVVSACPVLYACICAGISGGDYGCGNGGAGGNRGDVQEDIIESIVDLYYVNGNETGWVCVAQ